MLVAAWRRGYMNSWLASVYNPMSRKGLQTLLVGIFAVFGVLSGVVPDLLSPTGRSGTFAHAQQGPNITDDEIRNYARAVLLIEPRRKQAYDEIRGIAGGTVPEVICSDRRRINSLNRDLRAIAVNYCNLAKDFIEQHNLTINRFNEITRLQQDNPQLQRQIQAELLRQQRSNGN